MVRATLENDRQICNLCYEGGMASGMEAAESNVITQWQAFVDECNQELIARQNSLEQQFSLSRYAQWRCDQTAGQLVFSGHGDTRLIADVEFIGTCSEETGTWLWAWANFHLAGTIRNRITAVQQFGDAHALPRLTIRKWPASEQDGWEMAAIAARLLDARGVYRAPLKNGPLFMAIMDIRHAPTGSSY
ncbi:MAG: DUF6882 domain-containing protein [Burkholderiaceae bacterium]